MPLTADQPASYARLARGARAVLAWALATAACIAAVGLATDALSLAGHDTGARPAVVCGLATAGLGAFVALALAPFLAGIAALSRWIANRRGPLRFAWPLPAAAAAAAAAWIVSATSESRQLGTATIAFAFAGIIATCAVLARVERFRVAGVVAAVGIAALSSAADIALPKQVRDLHDMLGMVTVAATLAATRDLRRRMERTPLAPLVAAAAIVVIAAAGTLAMVDRASPGWRVRAWQYARYQGRLARALRTMVDFDLDGFSPIAWGGDCDDFDAKRNPFAHESPGVIDANCNGVTPSDSPTFADRGLAPEAGEPAMPGIDRVIVITVDCLRYDAVRPDVMPELTRLAARGVWLERLYAGGARTNSSLPLMLRGTDDAAPITRELTAAGVRVSAAFGWRDDVFTRELLPEYPIVRQPTGQRARWRAESTTDAAIAEARAAEGARQYLWVHYYDLHDPIVLVPGETRDFSYSADLSSDYGPYLAAAARVDREIGRLVGALGDLAKTVVIVTSDHGEGFGLHGIYYHAISGYEAVVHVPGILVAPGLAPARYAGLASHRDIPATVLGAFGDDAAARARELFGRSWLRLRAAPTAPLHAYVVARSARAAQRKDRLMPMAAIVRGDLKLIETFEDGLVEMYDPIHDPAEDDDLVPRDPDTAARLRRDLALYRDLDRWP